MGVEGVCDVTVLKLSMRAASCSSLHDKDTLEGD